MTAPPEDPSRSRLAGWIRSAVAEATAVLASYLALAVGLTYPLFARPRGTVFSALHEPASGLLVEPDINLTMWILAWGWRALLGEPARLFHGNIFHPAPYSLAGSEHLLGHLPIFGPVFAASGNLVLAYQIDILASFVLCGAGMYALLRHWGVSVAGAFVGGFVYAFCPVRAYDIGHIQLLAGQYFPLALLFLDRLLTRGGAGAAVMFTACVLLQLLCSYYLAYMALVALGGYALGVLWASRARLPLGRVVAALAGLLAAGVVVAALSVPYLRLRELGIVPGGEGASPLRAFGAGVAWNYLCPPGLVRKGVFPGRSVSLYLGAVPLGLALAALAWRRHVPRERVPWALAGALGAAAACYVMALGPSVKLGGWEIGLPYHIAMEVVPGFSSMRVPSRFAIMLMAGFAALAGLGFEAVARRLGGGGKPRRATIAVALSIVAVAAAEYDLFWRRFPVRSIPGGGPLSPVTRLLAELPKDPLVHIPAGGLQGELGGLLAESWFMYESIFHEHPILNGYSGYWPPSYAPLMWLVRALPDVRAAELLTRLTGLRYVVVHAWALPEKQRSRWSAPPGLKLVRAEGPELVFEIERRHEADLTPALLDFRPRSTSVLGTPLESLPPHGRAAALEVVTEPPAAMLPASAERVEVLVENRSELTWPALVSVGPHLVTLGYRWETESGVLIESIPWAARLPYDLAPGQSVRASVTVVAPKRVGKMRLVIGVAQDGAWFAGMSRPLSVELTVSQPKPAETGLAAP